MSKGKLVLIDGHALAYRGYYALPQSLTTSQGELTNAVFGFTSMLLNVLRDEKPDYIAVAFDVGKTFRHEEYKEYKAHRIEMPDELRTQMARIQEIVRALGIPIIEAEGYEADDVLGTLAQKAEKEGLETLIVTGDTDTFQLIDDHTRVLTSRRAFSDTVVYDQQGIEKRYGLQPHQLIDYKALVGDTSDNIPGVRGIGKKTATSLLQRYGSVEEIYAHLDEVESSRFRNALEKGRESAILSKFLVTIVTDLSIELDWEACRTSEFDQDKVKELFRELEFRTLLNRLPSEPGAERARQASPQQLSMFEEAKQVEEVKEERATPTNYQIVGDKEALDDLVARLSKAAAITLDTETTSTDAMTADLVGIALTDREGEGYYVPVGHGLEVGSWKPALSPVEGLEVGSGKQLPLDHVLEKLGPVLEDESIAKYAHNGKYDLTVLVRHGAQVKGLSFDTMIAEWLADPASRNLGLKNLAWARLGVEMTPITDLIGTGKKQITMAQVPVAQAARYACADVDMTHRLVKVLKPELRERELWPLFTEVEMPLVPVLAEMEMKGVKLDVEYLGEMSRQLHRQLSALEREIQETVGYAFNVNSTQQLSDALFVRLGLPAKGVQKTKSGHYSTAASVLEKLRGQHPVIELILEQRELAKLKSTYVDALPQLVNERTGRVHTSYNQTGTVTGRLSSSDPNLQNIPIRTEVGRQVRRAFVAEEGSVLLAADYSQVELRVLAHISQDEGLLAAFRRGEDIHASTAATIFEVPLDQVTREMRRVAKMINFGLSYGMSGYGLAQRTGLSQKEADRFIESYFANYPKVKVYMEETKREAAQQGYVETLLHRRRYFPELQRSKVPGALRRAAEREAINMPIQGSSADIIKIAMIQLHRALKERGLKSGMTLQVHDELVLEVPEGELEVVALLVKSIMEEAFELDAPLRVDMKVGRDWLEMK
ncbi:MAG: DNA polymerase I [Anaerolineae bacterium]